MRYHANRFFPGDRVYGGNSVSFSGISVAQLNGLSYKSDGGNVRLSSAPWLGTVLAAPPFLGGDEALSVDGGPVDSARIAGHFWVFYGALTNVEYTITVVDTVTGEHATYTNPPGRMASVGDTEALPD